MDHPSNTLYRGECGSIEEALDLVESELEYEMRLSKDFPDIESNFKDSLDEIRQLRAEYYQEINKVRDRLMREWQDREGWASELADAYFAEEYSSLAI